MNVLLYDTVLDVPDEVLAVRLQSIRIPTNDDPGWRPLTLAEAQPLLAEGVAKHGVNTHPEETHGNWATGTATETGDGLTTAANFYIESGKDLNDWMRGVEGGHEGPDPDMQAVVGELTSAMRPIPDDVTVYRGMDIEDFGLGDISELPSLVGQEVTEPGFLSTSTSKDQAKVFTSYSDEPPVLLELKVPKGSEGLYLDSVSSGLEKEFIWQPGSKVVFDGVVLDEDSVPVLTGTVLTPDQGKERGRESIPSPQTAQPPPPSPEVSAYQLLDYNAQRLATEFRPGIDDNPEIVALATERFQTALAQEQAITPILTQVADQTGGEFQHFDQRVKFESSIREKIPRIQREHAEEGKPVPSNAEAAAQITDLNRYTLMFPADSYGMGVQATVNVLASQGWTTLKAKNAWSPGDGYDGINAKFTNGDAVFEMQFHTPESAAIKDRSHALYQIARSPNTPPEQVQELQQQIFQLWNADRSFVPPGAETVFGTVYSYVGKAKEIAVSYYVKTDPTGDTFYRVRPDLSVEVLRVDGAWGPSSVLAVELAGMGGEVYEQATADQAGARAKVLRGDTPEVVEANRQLQGAIDEVEKHAQHDQSTHGNWADGLPEVEAKHEAPYGSPKPSVWDSKTLSFDSGDAGDLREAKRKWFITQSSKEVWKEIDTALDHSADSHFFDRGPFAEAVGHVYSGKTPQTDLQKGVALQRSWTQKVWERIYGKASRIPVYRVEGGPQARKSTGLVSFSVPENRSQLKAMAQNTGGKLVQDTVTKDEAVLLFWGEGRFRSNYVSVKGEVLAWRPERIGKHATHDQSTHGNWARGLSARQITTQIDEPDEGFTRHYPTGTEPTTGFAVALPGHEAKIEIERVTEGWVRQYRKTHAEALGRDDTNWGGWVEPNDSGGFDAYLDVSVVTGTYDEAAAIGAESGQLAIYDIERGETLYLEAS